jgi:hypothetical protein
VILISNLLICLRISILYLFIPIGIQLMTDWYSKVIIEKLKTRIIKPQRLDYR